MERREFTDTSAAPRPAGAYSQAVRVGDTVWTAGFGPQDPATGIVPEGIHAQTEQVLRNVAAALSANGLGLSDVVKITTHLQHLERDFAAYDAVCRTIFTPPFPARTTVGSTLLGILVEVDVVAVARR